MDRFGVGLDGGSVGGKAIKRKVLDIPLIVGIIFRCLVPASTLFLDLENMFDLRRRADESLEQG